MIKREWISAILSRLKTECNMIQETDNGIAFFMSGISGNENWNVFGHVAFVSSGMTQAVEPELMQLEWILLEHLPDTFCEQAAVTLQELNRMAIFGSFSINPYHELVYLHRCPITGHTAEEIASLFVFMAAKMLAFLDICYPYLLVDINAPERLTPDNLSKAIAEITLQHTENL